MGDWNAGSGIAANCLGYPGRVVVIFMSNSASIVECLR